MSRSSRSIRNVCAYELKPCGILMTAFVDLKVSPFSLSGVLGVGAEQLILLHRRNDVFYAWVRHSARLKCIDAAIVAIYVRIVRHHSVPENRF